MSKPRLLFLATEDWFFRSHFIGLAERARAEGFDVALAARASGAVRACDGVRVIDTGAARSARGPWALWREVAALKALIAAERPHVIHAIAMKPIVLAALACAREQGRVLALTGRGHLGASTSLSARTSALALRRLIRGALEAPTSVLAVENEADRVWVEGEQALPNRRVVLMPGAGVDPAAFCPTPEPEGPIAVGVAARLIRSKGVDVAVAALRLLRGRGLDIVLRIAGASDPDNPDHVSAREIELWRATPGVELLGRVADINAFWAGVHIACLPSRGGEGLPRALLEAAACARPMVTTETPGCADFARGAELGVLAPPGDAPALADALAVLAANKAQRQLMGAAGRALVEERYTIKHAADAAARAWRLVRPAR